MRTLALLAWLFLFSDAGLSRDAAGVWHSETHFGFAQLERSTTPFQGASGSLAFLDITRSLDERLAVGLRTSMLGAQQHQQAFYRLGAGPVLSWQWAENWSLVGNIAYFRESASNRDNQLLYDSHGWMGLVGWQRLVPLSTRAVFAWGAFMALHSGTNNNHGLARGAEIALRVAL